MQNKKSVDPLVNAVPADYQDDPGLLLRAGQWRERRGQQSGELEMLLRIRGESAPEVGREAIWDEKQSVHAPDDPRARLRRRPISLPPGTDFRRAKPSATPNGSRAGSRWSS